MVLQKENVIDNKVRITQIHSPIGKKFDQRQTLIGLGLNKMFKSRILIFNSSTKGMIEKIKHLIKIEILK